MKDERVTWRCKTKEDAAEILAFLKKSMKREVIETDTGIYIIITKSAYIYLDRIMRERRDSNQSYQTGL
jgi:hypothetical protein